MTSRTLQKRCKDCVTEGVTTIRSCPHPGPRCTTHWRAIKKARRARTHDVYMVRQYGLRPGEYEALKASQGGRCAICQVATGATKALALEHDHGHCATCATGKCCGAPEAIRGLACGPDNEIIGKLNAQQLIRAARYLLDPPGPAVIRELRREAREEGE